MLSDAKVTIHPTATVEPGAKLEPGVEVGPYSLIRAGARVGAECRIGPHCTIYGEVSLGERNVLHPGVALGGPPQSKGFDASLPSRIEIGDANEFREGFTAHRSEREGGTTRIGSDGFFMACSHVAHDCRVGDGVVFANNAVVGGHVQVGDRAFLSAGSLVHQFVRIGRLALLQGNGGASLDVMPFTIARDLNRSAGLHTVGLRRAGVSEGSRRALRRAYGKLVLSGLSLAAALDDLGADAADPYVAELVDFIRTSRRGVIRRPRTRRADTWPG